MLDQLKNDRVAQVLLAITGLVACVAVVIFGVLGYMLLNRAPSVALVESIQPESATEQPQLKSLTGEVKNKYITLIFLYSIIRVVKDGPGQPAENRLEELGQFVFIKATLEAILKQLNEPPPAGFEAAWEEARRAADETKVVFNQVVQDEISQEEAASLLAEPHERSRQAVEMATAVLRDEYGADETTIAEIGAEVEARINKAREDLEKANPSD